MDARSMLELVEAYAGRATVEQTDGAGELRALASILQTAYEEAVTAKIKMGVCQHCGRELEL